MKYLLPIFALICVSACHRKPAPYVPEKPPQLVAPTHPHITIYTWNKNSAGRKDEYSRMSITVNKPEDEAETGNSSSDKSYCKTKIKYLGRQDGGDEYLVTVSYPIPNGIGSLIKKVKYEGKEVEIWKDADYRVSMRPDDMKDGASK